MIRRRTILLVDDNVVGLSKLKADLEKTYELLTAGDGVEAVYMFERHAPRIAAIVTGLHLPRLNGDLLAEWVHHIKPRLPIVIISDEEVSAARSTRAVQTLARSFGAKQLQHVLRGALAQQ